MVYVDATFDCPGPRGYSRWCHMFADTEEELHAMAERIGMRREWFQDRRKGDHRFPHYDLVPSKRALAVKFGAEQVDRRRFCELVFPERMAARASLGIVEPQPALF